MGSTKVPRRLRTDRDPLEDFEPLVLEFEKLATSAADRYSNSSRRRIGDPLLVVATATADALLLESGDVDLLSDGEFAIAAQRAGISSFDFNDASAEELRGALTAVRGAAGEQWVLDRLTDRRLPVPEGTVRVDMLPFHTPGVDLQFTGTSGAIITAANVKVAQSADVIVRHFEKHPGVPLVYATSDAAQHAQRLGWTVVTGTEPLPADGPVVVDIGKSSSTFDEEILESLNVDSLVSAGIDLDDLIPWSVTMAIVARAAVRIRAGQARAEAARLAAQEGTIAVGATGAGALVSTVTSSELTVALTSFLFSTLGFGILQGRREWLDAARVLDHTTKSAERLAARFGSSSATTHQPWRAKMPTFASRWVQRNK